MNKKLFKDLLASVREAGQIARGQKKALIHDIPSAALRKIVFDMSKIIVKSKDEDERSMALHTLLDAINPRLLGVRVGSSLVSFLKDDGIFEETESLARKKVREIKRKKAKHENS